jgi:hypothetical protein
MFWFISDPAVMWLLISGVFMVILTSGLIVYSSMRFWMKSLTIPLIFVWLYASILVVTELLGWPQPKTDEFKGFLNGYVVYSLGDKKLIALLIQTDSGPRTYSVPYTETDARALNKAMSKLSKTGVKSIVSQSGVDAESEETANNKTPGADGLNLESKNSTLEIYDFVEQEIPQKN